jgi:hypothetical protein
MVVPGGTVPGNSGFTLVAALPLELPVEVAAELPKLPWLVCSKGVVGVMVVPGGNVPGNTGVVVADPGTMRPKAVMPLAPL